MNRKLNILLLLLMAVTTFGCSSDGDDEPAAANMILNKKTAAFTTQGGTSKLSIKTDLDWSVTGETEWCTLSKQSGDATMGEYITLTVSANRTADVRTTDIVFASGAESATLTVTQDAAELLLLSQREYAIESDGGTVSIKFQTSGSSYTLTPLNNWITATVSPSAMESKTVTFNVAKSKRAYDRMGYIAVVCGEERDTAIIVQGGCQDSIGHCTAIELAKRMTLGWNIGNTLEAYNNTIPSETAWGNPKVTKTLIDGVKAAGFNAVRIPCAWDGYIEDRSTYKIKDEWFERVEEVVDYIVDNDMYAILNIHWDGGWLENNPTKAKQTEVNAEQEALWTQIAKYFKNYDEHLVFSGTNEVHVDYNTPSSENITVQESYNQTFVDAVRATGGSNTTRNLIVQSYNTNIAYAVDYMTMPTDKVDEHLFLEVHFYDPYNYSLASENITYYWGKGYETKEVDTWGQEEWVDQQFSSLKTFVDRKIPIILGEFGANRHSLTDADMIQSRIYYLKYVVSAAKKNGIVPFYWDNGGTGVESMGLFDRSTGTVSDAGAVSGMVEASATNYPF